MFTNSERKLVLLMAYLHCQTRTLIPNPMATFYCTETVHTAQSQIQIPTRTAAYGNRVRVGPECDSDTVNKALEVLLKQIRRLLQLSLQQSLCTKKVKSVPLLTRISWVEFTWRCIGGATTLRATGTTAGTRRATSAVQRTTSGATCIRVALHTFIRRIRLNRV